MSYKPASVVKLNALSQSLRARIWRRHLDGVLRNELLEEKRLADFLVEISGIVRAYNLNTTSAENDRLRAAKKAFLTAQKATRLVRRKTFRNREYLMQIDRLNEAMVQIFRHEPSGTLFLAFCGITNEMVIGATEQLPPKCHSCREQQRHDCQHCSRRPAGSPFDAGFGPTAHGIPRVTLRDRLNPLSYANREQQLGLFQLLTARLRPNAHVFTKALGRPTDFEVQDLMFGMFEVFEKVYRRKVYEGNEHAMAAFDWLLALLGLDEIRPNYWMRRLERSRRVISREASALLAIEERWSNGLHE